MPSFLLLRHIAKVFAVFFNVKNFFDAVKLFFVIGGAVMGAGLLSGGELVAFFKGRDLFCLVLSGAVFFIGFAFIHAVNDRFIKFALIFADLVFAGAMLSGLDDIMAFAGIVRGVPIASVISLFVFHFLLSKDIKKVEKLNFILIPVSVAIVLCAVIFLKPSSIISVKSNVATNAINALLYASMNVFVALPTVSIAKDGKGNKVKISAALCFSAFFVLFAFLILRVSNYSALPLLDLAQKTALYPFLIVAIFIGSFTSLICYLYPLKNAIYKKVKNKNRQTLYCVLLYAGLFLLSRIGFGAIIKYFYPLVGGLGACAIIKGLCGIKTLAKGDTMGKRSALCPKRKRPKSKNLPKKNTATI